MMQTAEHWLCPHTMAVPNRMAARERREVIARSIRNAWSQIFVWPSSVVHHPLTEDARKCASFNGIIHSRHSRRIVPIARSQNAFACGDRTSGLEDRQTHRLYRAVHAIRVDAIAVMNDESMECIA